MSRLTALIIALAIGSLPMLGCSGGGSETPASAAVTFATAEASAAPEATATAAVVATPSPVRTPAPSAPAVTAVLTPPAGAGQVFTFPAGAAAPGSDFVITTPGAGGQFQAGVAVPFGGSGPGPGTGGAPQAMFVNGPTSPGLAQFLGISTEQLDAELKQPGATQATIAAKYGKSRDALKTFVLGQQRNNLDQAVRSGNMPKTLADQLLLQFTTDIDKLLDQAPGAGPVLIGPGQAVPAPR